MGRKRTRLTRDVSLFDKVRSGCNGVSKKIDRCNSQMYLLVDYFALQLRIPYKVLLFTVKFPISRLVVNNEKLYSKTVKKYQLKIKRTQCDNIADDNRRQ